MNVYSFDADIRVFGVMAASFPMGVTDAWQKLHSMLPAVEGRNFFAISRPEPSANGAIVYKAAVEESFPGEAQKYGCEIFVIKKGKYISETLANWQKDPLSIGTLFQKLLADKRIDPTGYCLEMYLNDGKVQCMVPLDASKE